MKNEIKPTKFFKRQCKKLEKKYRSLPNEIDELEKILLKQPKTGTLLGNNAYKIRLASKDKNKGKSGGFRVITYLITKVENIYEINLMAIYDKGDTETIRTDEINKLIKNKF